MAPAIVLLAAFATILLLVGVLEWSRRRSWANYSGDVTILESKLFVAPQSSYGADGKKTIHPMVVGWLQNDGARELDSVSLEGRVFNTDGELIDVIEGYARGSLKPGDKYPFKITGDEMHLPESDYANVTVVVTNAQDR